jgi:NitT/TauT family transport system substrate-binding protein
MAKMAHRGSTVRSLAVAGFMATTVLCSSYGAANAASDKVKFGWNAAFSVTLAHIAFGHELGFFDEDRIDLEIVQIQGAFAVLQQILSGGLDTGYVGLEAGSITKQRSGGTSPMKFIYNYTRETIWEIAVPEKSDIKSIKDLKGKRIATGSMASGNVPVTKAILTTLGMSPDDVSFQVTGQGAPAFRALQTGNVDALNLYDTQHATLEAMGFPLRRLACPKAFTNMPSHGFPVTNATLAEKRDVLARFGRAWSKSIVACKAAIQNCIHAYWKRYPDLAPRPGDESERMRVETIVLKARLDKLTSFESGAKRLLGSFSEQDWQTVAHNLKSSGQIESDKGPFGDLYSNELAEDYNRFDVSQVEARAKAKGK